MASDDSRNLHIVRAQFGLRTVKSAIDTKRRLEAIGQAGRALAGVLAGGQAALITGPSGSGKSVMLRAFADAVGAMSATAVSPSARRAPVNLIRGPLDDTLGILAACGLGEARRLVTPAGLLSEGERARLSLARALAHARRAAHPRDVVCDEFTSTLDRLTARSVARCVRRALHPRQRLVCATAHDDVAPHLDPDVVVYIPLVGPPQTLRRGDGRADTASASVA